MNKQTLKYIGFFKDLSFLGVIQKINNVVDAANEVGYLGESKFYINNWSGLCASVKDILKSNKGDIILIRLYDLFMPFLFPFLLISRFRGVRLILDIPTPRIIQLKEIRLTETSKVRMYLKITVAYLSASWVFIPFHRIIQYSEESLWFSFGSKFKTIKMGNGIKIEDNLSIVERKFTDRLELIGVAALAIWHGYDRIIKAIAVIKNKYPDFKIHFKIVGFGLVFDDLQHMVEQYGLSDNVSLTGSLQGDDLTQAFDGMHIGVGSLGLFRKGVEEASSLKTREYMARGLCVLDAGLDPDFTNQSPFRLLVSNDESIDSIVDLLLSIDINLLPSPLEVRKFAEENLSYKSKIAQILRD